MVIQCTKKLLDELKLEPVEANEEPLFFWHANIITIDQLKAIVLINDSNRYVVVIFGVKAKDKKDIRNVIKTAIRETLIAEGIKKEVVDRYLQYTPEVIFSKTKSRSMISKLNQTYETIQYYAEDFEAGGLIQSQMSRRLSTYPVMQSNELIYPNERMYEDIGKFYGQTIFQLKAVIVKVTLNLKKYMVWRRLIIPYNITFGTLHRILQTAFNWRNWHLHNFIVYDKDRPEVSVVQLDADLAFPGEFPKALETDTLISEYIPKFKQLLYRYDFGDNWEHVIEVEDLKFGYDKNYPVCLEGEGNTPPEDVGSESGYTDFLDIISNPKHIEHQQVKRWAITKGYNEFDIGNVNYNLRHTN